VLESGHLRTMMKRLLVALLVLSTIVTCSASNNDNDHYIRKRDLANTAHKWTAEDGEFVRKQDWGATNASQSGKEEDPTCNDDSYGMCHEGYHCECMCEDLTTTTQEPFEPEICDNAGGLCDNGHDACCKTSTTDGDDPTCASCNDCSYPQIVAKSCCSMQARMRTMASENLCCKCGYNEFKFVKNKHECNECHEITVSPPPSADACTAADGTILGKMGGSCQHVERASLAVAPPACCATNAGIPECVDTCQECAPNFQIIVEECCNSGDGCPAAKPYCCRPQVGFACVESKQDCQESYFTTTTTTSDNTQATTTTKATASTKVTTNTNTADPTQCYKPLNNDVAGNLGGLCDLSLADPYSETMALNIACCMFEGEAKCRSCDMCDSYQIVDKSCCQGLEDDTCQYCCKTCEGVTCVESESDCKEPPPMPTCRFRSRGLTHTVDLGEACVPPGDGADGPVDVCCNIDGGNGNPECSPCKDCTVPQEVNGACTSVVCSDDNLGTVCAVNGDSFSICCDGARGEVGKPTCIPCTDCSQACCFEASANPIVGEDRVSGCNPGNSCCDKGSKMCIQGGC